MGCRAVTVSYPGNYPGFQEADAAVYLDTRDAEGILKSAREWQIDGICTTGTDVAVRSLGYVAEKMSLPGLPFHAARVVTDKYEMRKALERSSFSVPFRRVFSEEEGVEALDFLGLPVMVKAVDSSGSRGILRVDKREDFPRAYREAMSVTKMPYLLMEPFIRGTEIGVDGLISGGELLLCIPHRKFVLQTEGVTVTQGHAFPFSAPDTGTGNVQDTVRLEKRIGDAIRDAVRVTGLDNCAFNADVMISDGEIRILEIGGRCGATCIPELLSVFTGADYYRMIVQLALGEKPCMEKPADGIPCMAKLIFSPADGRITRIDKAAIEALKDETADIRLDHPEGGEVEKMRNGTSRLGQVILRTDRESELDALLSRVCSLVEIDGRSLADLWKNK